MQNEDIQRELLKETVQQDKALILSINIEMGFFNQIQIKANKSGLNCTVNQEKRMRIANATPYSNMNSTARIKPTTCHFCGLQNHRTKCPARGKKCKNFSIENHFAKVCRKPKDLNSYPKPKSRVNNVENEDHQDDDVNQISADYNPDLLSNYSSDEDNCLASVSSEDLTTPIEPINLSVVFRNTTANALVDSGSVCKIIN